LCKDEKPSLFPFDEWGWPGPFSPCLSWSLNWPISEWRIIRPHWIVCLTSPKALLHAKSLFSKVVCLVAVSGRRQVSNSLGCLPLPNTPAGRMSSLRNLEFTKNHVKAC
jgi:hypothetical protein